MSEPDPKKIRLSVIQFLAMEPSVQMEYLGGYREGVHPFGCEQSPLQDFLTATYNLSRYVDKNEAGEPVDPRPLEELETVAYLMLCDNGSGYWDVESLENSREWRFVRRLARVALINLGYEVAPPCVPYPDVHCQIVD